MTEVEAAWLAGLLEGEGHLAIRRTTSTAGQRRWISTFVRLAMTDQGPIVEAARLMKTQVTTRNQLTTGGKVVYEAAVYNMVSVNQVLSSVIGFFQSDRYLERAADMLEINILRKEGIKMSVPYVKGFESETDR